jgi:transposase-like protein
MGRPACGVDDFVEWQDRLECQQNSGLSVEEFCQQEGVPKSTFYRWANQLRDGIPQALLIAAKARKQVDPHPAKFLPIALQTSPIEIEFPNGTMVRLPLDIGRPLLLEVIRIAGALRPWKVPKS